MSARWPRTAGAAIPGGCCRWPSWSPNGGSAGNRNPARGRDNWSKFEEFRGYYADAKAGVAAEQAVALLADPGARVDWDAATAVSLGERDLEKVPAEEDAFFAAPPPEAANARSYPAWSRAFAEWLVRTRTLELLRSPSTGAVSRPGESERDFRIRLAGEGHEQRDTVTERIRRSYAPRIARLEERIRAAEAAVAARSRRRRPRVFRRRARSGPRSSGLFSAAGKSPWGPSAVPRRRRAGRGGP